MQIEDHKTLVSGTPFFVEPSFAMFIDRHDGAAYETRIPFVTEGVTGILHISLEEGRVHVSLRFGDDRETFHNESAEPLVIDGTSYTLTLRLPAVALAEFDLETVSGQSYETGMFYQDQLYELVGLKFQAEVAKDSPLFVETGSRFERAVSARLREFSIDYPGFGQAFREAVARAEIARLREIQTRVWNSMVSRTAEIRSYMAMVPDEATKLAPEAAWPLASEERETRTVAIVSEPARICGAGVEKVQIHLNSVASLAMIDLIDGTSEMVVLD
jgi:hypothetical protein